MSLANRVAEIKSSLTVEFDGKVKDMIAVDKLNGIDSLPERTIALAAGEPDFDPPKAAIEAIQTSIHTPGTNRYTPVKGKAELLTALSEWFKKTRDLTYEPAELISSPGGKADVFLATFSLVNPGDRVLIFSPYWTSYPEIVKMCGGIPVIRPWEEMSNLQKILDEEDIRVIILNSPNNPSGQIISPQVLGNMAFILSQKDIWVISDEVYSAIVYSPFSHVSIAQFDNMQAKTVIIDSASKIFAMAAYRLGFAAGPKEVIAAMAKFQGQITSCPSSLAQAAVLASLTRSQADVDRMKESYERRLKTIILPFARELQLEYFDPQGAFYLFFKIPGEKVDCLKFCEDLLEQEKLGLVPGLAFGYPGWVRISFAASDEDLIEGLARLKRFLSK